MPDRVPGLLGRLPAQFPGVLRDLGFYAAGPLPKAPATLPVPVDSDWGMLGNDRYGDCGFAGFFHGVEADEIVTHEPLATISDQDVIAAYLKYTGGQDTGVVLSQFLTYVRQQPTGLLGHKVDAFAPVAVHDVPTLQTAIYLFDFAYTGIAVTDTMMQAFQAGQPWTTGLLREGTVEGGHCIPLVGYDEQFVYAVTWGAIQAITWNCWHYISSEAWAVLTGELVARNGDGRGVNLAALRADLDKLNA
jgi:hypothetical protein